MKPYRINSSSCSLISIILLTILCTSSLLLAGNSKITGRVVDRESGEALPGANVIITHSIGANNVEVPLDHPLGSPTDVDGYYFILNVPPGTYIIKASMVGFSPVIQKHIRVESDRTITVNFRLATEAIEHEPIVITGRGETVRADVSSTQEVIGSQRIESMPVTRIDEFVNKLKGVELVSDASGHGLSIRGGAIRETDIRLDGISLQDPRSENSYLALNSTTVQEMQVLTGGFEAKYGGIRSGLLNVVTKEGQRERYTFDVKVNFAPSGQKKFFGTNPWSNDSWIYRVYAGDYAMKGVKSTDTLVPTEFRTFGGWGKYLKAGNKVVMFYTGNKLLDSTQNLDIWKRQHPQYPVANRNDIFVEGSVTGPFPGDGIPVFEEFARRTTFLLGFKYEDTQFAFPLGPRDSYTDWNAQAKLTTRVTDNIKMSTNAMYAKVQTVNGGQTTNYGGALVDQSSSFNFLTTTESSVRQQARLIGGANLWQIFNKSRLQYFDQRYIVGGVRLTHTLSNSAFYTLDFQMGYNDQELQPFRLDTSRADAWYTYRSPIDTTKYFRYLNAPQMGSPNASTNPGYDLLNMFRTYGGLQRIDSSYSYVYQLKGDLTMQLGRHNQLEAGFSLRIQNLFVYTGTWYQATLSFEPYVWQYFKAKLLDGGLYIQDKLEFEGMVLNAGLRLDYFNPNKRGFDVNFPLSEDYYNFYNEVYRNLGTYGDFNTWKAYRELIENPPGWPRTENYQQLYLSPRLGVSFAVTENSKLYFSYGHNLQRPAISFLYNLVNDIGGVTVPTPDLKMAKTISYEFGYEQLFFSGFLLNATAYYKDVRNEPLSRQFISYYEDIKVARYFADAYSDSRGVELRVEIPRGDFITLSAMYDYRMQSWGQSGLQKFYENRLAAKEEMRPASLYRLEPMPRANATLNFHTPIGFGEHNLGVSWFNNLMATFLFEWRDGGRMLWNPGVADIKDRIYVDVVDSWNIDFRGSITFDLSIGTLEFSATIKNLTNNKFLSPENMLQTQYDAYKASLKFPHQGGGDSWGDFRLPHINTGWWDAPIFLNPRRILIGTRLTF